MDPNACLAKWENAVKVGDVGEADEVWVYLADWLRAGGFPPKWDTATRQRWRTWGVNAAMREAFWTC